MLVKDFMTAAVVSCRPQDSLEKATHLLWDNDCGALPVVDRDGMPRAMVTDRDICMAAYTRGKLLRDMIVADCMSKSLVTCSCEEELATAARKMMDRQVRRLPVIDATGKLTGILSLNDIALAVGPRTTSRIEDKAAAQALNVLQATCRHRPAATMPPAAATKAAAAASAKLQVASV